VGDSVGGVEKVLGGEQPPPLMGRVDNSLFVGQTGSPLSDLCGSKVPDT